GQQRGKQEKARYSHGEALHRLHNSTVSNGWTMQCDELHATRPGGHAVRWAFGIGDSLLGWRGSGCANQLHINGDGYVVADNRGSSIHSVVLAIDLGTGRGAHVGVALLILYRRRGAINIKDDLLGNAMNGEIAGNLQLASAGSFDTLGLKRQRGVLGNVEEVRAAQVVVTPLHARVNGVGINGSLQRCLTGIGRVIGDSTAYLGEGSANCRDTHMAYRELCCGVVGIDLPGLGLGQGGSGESYGCGNNQQ